MSRSDSVIAATRTWVDAFVVAHNVCPFAGRELRRNAIRYVCVAGDDWPGILTALLTECRGLDADEGIATTLLVMPDAAKAFEDYLDLLAIAETLLVDQGYEGIYQLASFHPDYCFADAEPGDPANFTNRSPWPMLHLLREADIEKALEHYANPEAIPERNIQAMQHLGGERLARQLARLRQSGAA